MARVTVEDCMLKINNRFTLVMAASKRTKNLLEGSRPLVPARRDKPHVLALREIAAGKVVLKENGAETQED